MPQDPYLFSGTLRENLNLGDEAATDETIERALRIPERLRRRSQDRDCRGDQRSNTRNGHQAPSNVVLLGPAGDLGIELADLCLQMGEDFGQHLQRRNGIGWPSAVRVVDDGDQSCSVGGALRYDLGELPKVAPERIDRLRPLADQQLADPEHHRGPLGLFTLHWNEAHRRAIGRFADRFSIGSVVLLALHERLDVCGRDEANLVAQLADLAAPEVCAAAGFHRHQARRQLAEERPHLIPSQLLAQGTKPRRVSAIHMKHILR